MKQVAFAGRLANALYTNGTKASSASGQRATIAHTSNAFGIQNNFTISVITHIPTPNFTSTIFSKGANTALSPMIQMDIDSGGIVYVGWYDQATSPSPYHRANFSTGYSNNGLFNRTLQFDWVKTNASPGTSVSPSEWKLYVQGVLMSVPTAIVLNGGFSPSYDVNSTSSFYLGFVPGGSYFGQNYYMDFKAYSRELTQAEIATKFVREGRWKSPDNCEVIDLRFTNKNGKTIADVSGNGFDATLDSYYTDVETATGANPQSGNTVWRYAYQPLIPIIV